MSKIQSSSLGKNLVVICGRRNSGKDELTKMLQYWTNPHYNEHITYREYSAGDYRFSSVFENKKFADKLKELVAHLIGCTLEQLEDRDFKEGELGEEWWYINAYLQTYDYKLNKDRFDAEFVNLNLVKLTPRSILQTLGTEAGRKLIHPQIWVNSLFADLPQTYYEYGPTKYWEQEDGSYTTDSLDHMGMAEQDLVNLGAIKIRPKWIISDCRFDNELQACKNRGALTIRIKRDTTITYTDQEVYVKLRRIGYTFTEPPEHDDAWVEIAINEGFKSNEEQTSWTSDEDPKDVHSSETSVDKLTGFDIEINNNGSLEDLLETAKSIAEKYL